MKLHIGCGGNHLEGYKNLDIVQEKDAADELIDCSNILAVHPEWEGQVDEILGYHVFEHFFYTEAMRALEHYHKLLKPGGKLILEMPDLDRCIGMYLMYPTDKTALKQIFGSHAREGQVHHWGWSPSTLGLKLDKFSRKRFTLGTDYHMEEAPAFRVEATK